MNELEEKPIKTFVHFDPARMAMLAAAGSNRRLLITLLERETGLELEPKPKRGRPRKNPLP